MVENSELRKAGLKVTLPRVKILQMLDSAGLRHMSAEDVYKALMEAGEDVGSFLGPRGRFAMELYGSFMRLVGRSYEFKVPYRAIARMFFLPKPSPSGEDATR